MSKVEKKNKNKKKKHVEGFIGFASL